MPAAPCRLGKVGSAAARRRRHADQTPLHQTALQQPPWQRPWRAWRPAWRPASQRWRSQELAGGGAHAALASEPLAQCLRGWGSFPSKAFVLPQTRPMRGMTRVPGRYDVGKREQSINQSMSACSTGRGSTAPITSPQALRRPSRVAHADWVRATHACAGQRTHARGHACLRAVPVRVHPLLDLLPSDQQVGGGVLAGARVLAPAGRMHAWGG